MATLSTLFDFANHSHEQKAYFDERKELMRRDGLDLRVLLQLTTFDACWDMLMVIYRKAPAEYHGLKYVKDTEDGSDVIIFQNGDTIQRWSDARIGGMSGSTGLYYDLTDVLEMIMLHLEEFKNEGKIDFNLS